MSSTYEWWRISMGNFCRILKSFPRLPHFIKARRNRHFSYCNRLGGLSLVRSKKKFRWNMSISINITPLLSAMNLCGNNSDIDVKFVLHSSCVCVCVFVAHKLGQSRNVFRELTKTTCTPKNKGHGNFTFVYEVNPQNQKKKQRAIK